MLTPTQVTDYVETGGLKCPVCGGPVARGECEADDYGATRIAQCKSCGEAWRERLTLSDVLPLEE